MNATIFIALFATAGIASSEAQILGFGTETHVLIQSDQSRDAVQEIAAALKDGCGHRQGGEPGCDRISVLPLGLSPDGDEVFEVLLNLDDARDVIFKTFEGSQSRGDWEVVFKGRAANQMFTALADLRWFRGRYTVALPSRLAGCVRQHRAETLCFLRSSRGAGATDTVNKNCWLMEEVKNNINAMDGAARYCAVQSEIEDAAIWSRTLSNFHLQTTGTSQVSTSRHPLILHYMNVIESQWLDFGKRSWDAYLETMRHVWP